MNAVVQQFENHDRQREFVLFFAHFFAGKVHSFGIDVFFADKFCRIASQFPFDGKTVAVDHCHHHGIFVNRNVGRFEVDDVVSAGMQRRHH